MLKIKREEDDGDWGNRAPFAETKYGQLNILIQSRRRKKKGSFKTHFLHKI